MGAPQNHGSNARGNSSTSERHGFTDPHTVGGKQNLVFPVGGGPLVEELIAVGL